MTILPSSNKTDVAGAARRDGSCARGFAAAVRPLRTWPGPPARPTGAAWPASPAAPAHLRPVGPGQPPGGPPGAGRCPGAPGPLPAAAPFEPLPPHVALGKVKTLLTGLAPTADELPAVQADPGALRALVDGWMGTPEFRARMSTFFQQAFQQTQTDVGDYVDLLGRGPTGSEHGRLLVRSIEESFARTVLALVEQGRPFTETATTDTFMLNPPLMSLLALLDAAPPRREPAAHPQGRLAPGPLPRLQAGAHPQPRSRHRAAPPDPLRGDHRSGQPQLRRVLRPHPLPRHRPAGLRRAAGDHGAQRLRRAVRHDVGPPARRLRHHGQPVQARGLRGLAAGQDPPAGAGRGADPVLGPAPLPRPGHAPSWCWRRRGSAFSPRWPSSPTGPPTPATPAGSPPTRRSSSAWGAASTTATSPSSCPRPASTPCTCSRAPSASPATRPWTRCGTSSATATTSPTSSSWPPSWCPPTATFTVDGSPPVMGRGIATFARALAEHPRFAAAWTQKLCQFANSESCDPEDPELQRVAAAFRDSGFDFKVLVRELFSSPLVTFVAPDQDRGDLRHRHQHRPARGAVRVAGEPARADRRLRAARPAPHAPRPPGAGHPRRRLRPGRGGAAFAPRPQPVLLLGHRQPVPAAGRPPGGRRAASPGRWTSARAPEAIGDFAAHRDGPAAGRPAGRADAPAARRAPRRRPGRRRPTPPRRCGPPSSSPVLPPSPSSHGL